MDQALPSHWLKVSSRPISVGGERLLSGRPIFNVRAGRTAEISAVASPIVIRIGAMPIDVPGVMLNRSIVQVHEIGRADPMRDWPDIGHLIKL